MTAFVDRHIGPRDRDLAEMLALLGYSSLDALADAAVPNDIRLRRPLDLPAPVSEHELIGELRALAGENRAGRSFIGMGYYDTLMPPVLQRCILENPAWYTQYTPYQAEISQGRLEMLLTYQTLVCELTGLPVANASLLDEGTAAAEAMAMCHRLRPRGSRAGRYLVSSGCHPQTLEIVVGRAEALGIPVDVADLSVTRPTAEHFGVLTQYPDTHGAIIDPRPMIEAAHAVGALVTVATDLLALCVIASPGSLGADIAVGNSQRFGVPLGYGGPHAAFFATREAMLRQMPGRLIGVSRDAHGRPALRMAIQTREQHIRREKATSNICTAQVLLAILAGGYAVYHGPEGLRAEAEHVATLTARLRAAVIAGGHTVAASPSFDTLRIHPKGSVAALRASAEAQGLHLRYSGDGAIGISLDGATTLSELTALCRLFGVQQAPEASWAAPSALERTSDYLHQSVFHAYRSETELLRYLKRLEGRDLSLANAMIPLGSCTMKLNAAAEMMPITLAGFGRVHPFAPPETAAGYASLFRTLEGWLCEITGFDAASLQPNAGSQGEYAGLLVIAAFHRARGDAHRNVCLIPTSAHGTNPASAAMAGFEVVPVACDENGNIDLADLDAKATAHAATLGALMVTYPSTHGVFEPTIRRVIERVHAGGGQVYLDGANMNAQVGLCRPGDYGADVCHLNLHKTFCIPHGGGGPGVGPICVKQHLAPFLPGHPVIPVGGEHAIPAISAAPWGSASILPIPWAYIRMMGAAGLRKATEVALLSANYVARRLEDHLPVLYRGPGGLVAHECIVDVRPLKAMANVSVEDVAKRLIDYGFHAPTMSWPVAGTLMIEPTESESKAELDRFCDALIAIKAEAEAIARGELSEADNPLRNAPHTAADVTADEWPHAYPRSLAAWPLPAVREHKFWPAVSRVDNTFGDRNVVCACT